MKTKFASYCINGIAKGCKFCVKGCKLVLFITGYCSVNCKYCSLSCKRKGKDIIWANERECKSVKEVIQEAEESNAKGAGITGGDPLLFLNRTLKFAKALKKHFKKFHIHIYLPLTLVNESKLKKLKTCVDEVRFHPSFLSRKVSETEMQEDIEKIKLACKLFRKENTGCEMPLLPDKKKEILKFIAKVDNYVGFINLNEFEISDTNLEFVTKNYKLNEDTYTISGSKTSGAWILNQAKKLKLKAKIHVCTAETKNFYQYRNRLKIHKILPYGTKTGEGTVIYFSIYSNNLNKIESELKNYKKFYVDKKSGRIILSPSIVKRILSLGKYKIARTEEFPTSDRDIAEMDYISR